MNTKLEILKYVEKYTDILDEIGNIKDRVLIEDSSKDLFSKINNKLKSRKERLKKPKFEVAIIGLEKAGKSTFANALLKDDAVDLSELKSTALDQHSADAVGIGITCIRQNFQFNGSNFKIRVKKNGGKK